MLARCSNIWIQYFRKNHIRAIWEENMRIISESLLYFSQYLFLQFCLCADMRKSIYSFIHTKPISSRNYVLGKYIAGISMVLLFVVILTAIVDVVAVSAGNSYGYKTSLWDIWANIIMYDLPGILLTGCIMLFISILFKNVIPAIPWQCFCISFTPTSVR